MDAQNNYTNTGKLWWKNVRSECQSLARKILEDCDWTWTRALLAKGIDSNLIEEYKLFILCKIVANDIQKPKGASRLFLSPPSGDVDEVWHEHMLRPISYMNMCWTLLKDRVKENNESLQVGGFMIDHTPESEEDEEAEKEVRRQRTEDYMTLIWKKVHQVPKKHKLIELQEEGEEEEQQQQNKKKQKRLQMISLKVKVLGSRAISMELPADAVIGDITKKLQDEKVSMEDRALLFANTYLPLDKSLADCQILNGSELFLVHSPNAHENNNGPATIYVQTTEGKKYSFTILLSQTVKDVKQLIDQQHGISEYKQRLIFGGQELDENGVLSF